VNPPLTFPSEDALLSRLSGILRPRKRKTLEQYTPALRESAVLLPLLLPASGVPELLFTVRHDNLPTHSGQIAFPGGKRERSDPSLEHTALRESAEEIGLPIEQVQIGGLLDDVATLELFSITPVVGVVAGLPVLSPNEKEVSAVFRAPLDALARSYHHAGYNEWSGVVFSMHEFLFQDAPAEGISSAAERDSLITRRIWGATARITLQFLQLLELLPPRLNPDMPRQAVP
jgi:8-oxo-dGTP pyrophosphatase MutT (NUDIX family)